MSNILRYSAETDLMMSFVRRHTSGPSQQVSVFRKYRLSLHSNTSWYKYTAGILCFREPSHTCTWNPSSSFDDTVRCVNKQLTIIQRNLLTIMCRRILTTVSRKPKTRDKEQMTLAYFSYSQAHACEPFQNQFVGADCLFFAYAIHSDETCNRFLRTANVA